MRLRLSFKGEPVIPSSEPVNGNPASVLKQLHCRLRREMGMFFSPPSFRTGVPNVGGAEEVEVGRAAGLRTHPCSVSMAAEH